MSTDYDDHVQDLAEGSAPGQPDVDKQSCQLFGTTALIVQGVMGIIVILSLLFKRYREKPRRPWRIWIFDVSKQVVGQMFVHGVNVLVSVGAADEFSANACVFYFLNILLDTTLGVAIIYGLLYVSTYILSNKLHLEGFESGQYGKPPKLMFWVRQAAIYGAALTAMKFIVLGMLILFPFLGRFGEWLLSWTYTHKGDGLQVVFVMGIFPVVMNVLQFWLIDSIVKASEAVKLFDEERPDHDAHEPLFRASEDNDDDDEAGARHADHGRQPRSMSRSISPPPPRKPEDKSNFTPQESKSIASSSSRNDLPNDQESRDHADGLSYPPSLSSSLTSADSSPSTSFSHHSTPSSSRSKRRRSPPRALDIHVVHQPAINSPVFSAPPLEPTMRTSVEIPSVQKQAPRVAQAPSANDWDAGWADDAQDWADHVGEEEWTGRRLETVKAGLKDGWDTPNTGAIPVHRS